MREYTFLTSSGFRTRHVLANSLREAVETTMYLYENKPSTQDIGTIYLDYYQAQTSWAVMSGWTQSQDKLLKGKTWKSEKALDLLKRI